LTVTHPDMMRYFMTIPEACSLVLEAAVMGKGGEVFVFEMGKPVRILDLAKSMIRLSGLIPEKDIAIEFTGVRPGEKLYEEIFSGDDNLIETHHPKILIGRVKQLAFAELNRQIDGLLVIAPGDDAAFREGLKGVVSEYSPMSGDR
jgi:FlaA1/EpsC-like NDP-sugar epimerase